MEEKVKEENGYDKVKNEKKRLWGWKLQKVFKKMILKEIITMTFTYFSFLIFKLPSLKFSLNAHF